MRTLVLGDAHGLFAILENIVNKNPKNLQFDQVLILGDVGLGFAFSSMEKAPFTSNVPLHFIRGNHDNPEKIKNLPQTWIDQNWHYIPDGTIQDGVLYIGGALSIDWKYRTPGWDWWFDEELNDQEMDVILQKVLDYDDEIHTVVTHDCPFSLYPLVGVRDGRPSKTSWFLEELRENVLIGPKRPSVWYFGHHHKTVSQVVDQIDFHCIAAIDDFTYEIIDMPKILR